MKALMALGVVVVAGCSLVVTSDADRVERDWVKYRSGICDALDDATDLGLDWQLVLSLAMEDANIEPQYRDDIVRLAERDC